MAKMKKSKDLPEGMSRRQAKLAARAAERAALERDPRPYAGLAIEKELVALQEFVPSATAEVVINGQEITLATVLPGAVAALVREDGKRFVALQVASRSQNPGRDLAFVTQWVLKAQPGEQLPSSAADGSEPTLDSFFGGVKELQVKVENNFDWWLPEDAQVDPYYRQSVQQASDSIMPSVELVGNFDGIAWALDSGNKGYIRWVRDEEEAPLVRALARVAARRELSLGENTKFAGVFRTHGICVPVFDVDREVDPVSYVPALEVVSAKVAAELANEAPLNAEERKQVENIKSRQVTIR